MEVQTQVQLWNVVEDSEGEGGEDQAKQKEHADTCLVDVLVRPVSRTVARDVITKTNSGQGNEDEVDSIKNCPVWFKKVEKCWRNDNGKEQEYRAHQSKVNKTHLEYKLISFNICAYQQSDMQ